MDEAQRLVELIPRLRRYARALVGERAAADDLVQDTLERAWTKLHLYRQGTDLRAPEESTLRVQGVSAAESRWTVQCLNCGEPLHGPFCAMCSQRD